MLIFARTARDPAIESAAFWFLDADADLTQTCKATQFNFGVNRRVRFVLSLLALWATHPICLKAWAIWCVPPRVCCFNQRGFPTNLKMGCFHKLFYVYIYILHIYIYMYMTYYHTYIYTHTNTLAHKHTHTHIFTYALFKKRIPKSPGWFSSGLWVLAHS